MLDEDDEELAQVPASALTVMKILADQLRAVDAHVSAIDEQIGAWQRENASAEDVGLSVSRMQRDRCPLTLRPLRN